MTEGRITRWGSLWLLLNLVLWGSAHAEIEVFCTRTHCVDTGEHAVTTYRLDAVARVKETLNQRLDRGRGRTRAELRATLQAAVTPASVKALRQGFTGILRAQQLGVKYAPAVVFDGRAVIYGVPDLDRAIAHFEAVRTR